MEDREQPAIKNQNFWDDRELTGEPIDLLAFLAVFLSRWPFILLLGVGGAAAALGLSFLVTPRFISKAVFLPPTQEVTSTDNPLALFFKPPSTAIYSGLLLSDSVVTEVVQRNDLQKVFHAKDLEDARTALRSITSVSADSAGFVTLQVTYKDPNLAHALADSFMTGLARLNDRLAVNEAAQHRMLFQSQLEKAKNDLEASEVALERAQKASGVISPESQTRSGLTAIDSTRAEIAARQVALSSLLQAETEQSPDVMRARSEISALEAQLSRLQSGAGAPGSGLSPSQAPSVNLEFVRLEREVKYNQVLFDVMAKQYENAKLAESSAAPSVQVVDFPEVPLHKSWPTRRLFVLVGGVIGFGLALAIVFSANRFRALKEDPERSRSLQAFRDRVLSSKLKP